MNISKALLEQWKRDNERQYEKKEYNTFKPAMGNNYLAVLDQGDNLPFATTHYHKFGDKFINCLEDQEKSSCPVCSSLKEIWDDKDAVRQSTYREIKKKEKTTLEIVELNADGSIKDPTPKLFTISKTAFKCYFDDLFAGKNGVLVIVKKNGNPYADYSDTHIDENIQINGILPESVYKIHTMTKYDRATVIKALNPVLRSLGMIELPTVVQNTNSIQNADGEDDDIAKFKNDLLKEIGA